MSNKTILHQVNFDDGQRYDWGMIETFERCELVEDTERPGKCLVTKIFDRAGLDCPQRTLEHLSGQKLTVSFDLRVENATKGFLYVAVVSNGKYFDVRSPVPTNKWQRYTIPVDLTGVAKNSLDLKVSYSEKDPTTRAFFDNIIIEN
jgi:hypothetical protein